MAGGAGEEPIIRRATAADLPAAARCYARNGYGGGIGPDDDVLVAERGGEVVGVVRLVREHGILLLRGFFVDAAERGRGLGRRMMPLLLEGVGPEDCWLVCGSRLVPFYGESGFEPASDEEVPAHLPPRAEAYAREHGPQAVLRRRSGGGHN